jgi:hypothetical protein
MGQNSDGMAKRNETQELTWPRRAACALLGRAAAPPLTDATLGDIL